MAKSCCAIIPPCCEKEPPPPEASLCLHTEVTPDIKRLLAVCGPFTGQGGLIAPQVSFFVKFDRLPTKNTGWS